MKSEAQILADYQGRVLLPAAVLALEKDRIRAKSVVSPSQVANSVERYFQVRPSEEATVVALELGSEYKVWRIIGKDVGNLHAEVLPHGIDTYVNSWKHVEDSDLYALETVGASHLTASLRKAEIGAKKAFKYSQDVGRDSIAGLDFDKLRDGISFLHGLHQYRLRGRVRLPGETKETNWTKLGALAAIIAIPVAVFLWWLH